jgi:hypothetical protein
MAGRPIRPLAHTHVLHHYHGIIPIVASSADIQRCARIS